jgi:hypothetical protein
MKCNRRFRARTPLGWAVLLTVAPLAGCTGFEAEEGTWLGDIAQPFATPTPAQAARDAFNVYNPDRRRRAIALLAASPFGHEAPYVRTYRLLLDDPDPTVRAAAIRALSMHGTPDDARGFLPSLRDPNPYVRWETAEALKRVHLPEAAAPLVQTLQNDDDNDVRMAAAEALAQYPRPSVFDALLGTLTDPNYGVAQAAANSLSILTGRDFGRDPAAWIAWSNPRRDRLFADQLPYSFQPYQRPPGWMDTILFWRDTPEVPRQRPIGHEAAAPRRDDPAS